MNSAKNPSPYLNPRNLVILFASIAGIATAWVLAQTPPLVALTLPIIVCSFWLMQKAVGVFNLRVQTIPGCGYLVYVATILIPSFFVYAEQRDPFRRTFLFAVESALLTLPLGILFAKRIFQFDPKEARAFFNLPVEDGPRDPGPEVYFLFLLIAWILTCLYVSEVRSIPLFYMIAHPGEYEVLTRLREESLKLLNSPLVYAYNLLSSTLYRFLIVFAFGRYLLTRRVSWALLFLGSLIPGLLYAGFTIAKAPAAATCLILCVYFYFHRRGKVGWKFILLCVFSLLAFPLFVMMQQFAGAPNADLLSALQAVGTRLFSSTVKVLYYYFEVFPHVVPYQHGKTIGKLATLMGERTFDSANVVGRYMLPKAIYSVNANAPFLGNLNADFGMAGVLVGGFVAGMILEVAQIYLVRRGKSVLNLTIYAIFFYESTELSSSALPVVLLGNGPIFVLLLAWAMTILDSMMQSALRIRRRSSRLRAPTFDTARRF